MREFTTETQIEKAAAYAAGLADRENDALGFLPHTIYAPAIAQGRLHLVEENGEPCGFILHGPMRPTLRIYQTAVEPTCRLIDHGRAAWLATLAEALDADIERLTWICATDLTANAFWSRVSGPPKKTLASRSQTRRALHAYEHVLPRGKELEQYLERQLHNSTLWKIARFQGIDAWLEQMYKLRFRKTR